MKFLCKKCPAYSLGIHIDEPSVHYVLLARKNRKILTINQGLVTYDSTDIKQTFKTLPINKAYLAIPSIQILKIQANKPKDNMLTYIKEPLHYAHTPKQSPHAFAMRKNDLEKHASLLKKIGITPICIEPDTHAFLRAVQPHLPSLTENECHVIHYEHNHKHFFIFFNEQDLLFERWNPSPNMKLALSLFHTNFPSIKIHSFFTPTPHQKSFSLPIDSHLPTSQGFAETGRGNDTVLRKNLFTKMPNNKSNPLFASHSAVKVLNIPEDHHMLSAKGAALRGTYVKS